MPTHQTFARRFAALSVRAARRANHLAIVCRQTGEPDDIAQSEAFREMARCNIREAKNRKALARQKGEW